MGLMSLLEQAGVKNNVPWSTKKYKSGEVIVEENSPGSELFLICKGNVHIVSSLQITIDHSEEKGIAKLSEGDFEIGIIDGGALLDFMDANPAQGYPIMRFLFETLVERMRNNNIRANAIMGFYLREAGG